MFPRRGALASFHDRSALRAFFNDTERRLRGITVGYSSARVTFQTSHERSRDIPRGPGAFVPIWRHIIPESGQTVRPFPRGVPCSWRGFRVFTACRPPINYPSLSNRGLIITTTQPTCVKGIFPRRF